MPYIPVFIQINTLETIHYKTTSTLILKRDIIGTLKLMQLSKTRA